MRRTVYPFPSEIRIENTNCCNAHCTICPREKLTRAQGVMSMGLFRNIIDECSRQGCVTRVTIQGFGEPMLDPAFCEKVRYVKDNLKAITYTVTNASLLTEKLCNDIVQSGLDKIKISFYGTTVQEYESTHRNLSFKKVRQNIYRLLAAKKRFHSRTPRIRIQYIGRYYRFFRFFLQWAGKTSIGFNTLHNYGAGRNYLKVAFNKKDRRCEIISQPIIQILWNGDIVPCCYDFNDDICLGKAGKQSIEEIWTGLEYQKFRQAHYHRNFTDYPLCFQCNELK